MGIVLLIFLSSLFGWIFTEQKNREVEKLQLELAAKQLELERVIEQHEFEKRVWKNTVKELL